MHMLGVESALDYPQNIPGLFKYVNIGSKQEEGGPSCQLYGQSNCNIPIY